MVSLAVKLRNAATFTNFGTLQTLIDTAKQYIALDQGLDLLSLASDMQHFSGGRHQLPDPARGTLRHNRRGEREHRRREEDPGHRRRTSPPTNAHARSARADRVGIPHSTASTPVNTQPTSTGPASYTNSQQPMQSGAIPCVN
ncbi:hypothetical protein [Microbacterium laevaniformans]|uniref:hypothetical protein n=1 Tax=Microbacterium laevaniformans TaxID=36807 RepID=UPI0031EEA834